MTRRALSSAVCALVPVVACTTRVPSSVPAPVPAVTPVAGPATTSPPESDDGDGDGEIETGADSTRPSGHGHARKQKPCAADLAHCPAEGCATPGSPHALFNQLKRRVTAADGRAISRSTAATVTFDALRALQTQADALVGQKHELDENERKKIAALKVGALTVGEGTGVRLAGYLAPRSHGASSGSHPGGIESVNCRLDKEEWRDIHIDVMAKPDHTECDGVVVEMIPQGRAAHPRWTKEALDQLASDKKLVMIVGPLFYDNEHKTRPDCAIKMSEPKRMSLWEIHPIVEVWTCDDASCTPDAERGWKRFD